MKAPKRPFIVEVKHRRRQSARENTIWAAIDLKAATREVMATDAAVEDSVMTANRAPQSGTAVKRTDVIA